MLQLRLRRPRARARLLFAACALLACACRSTPAPEPVAPPPAPVVPWRELGASLEGRPIRGAVFDRGDETVLLLAGIHGDEAAGGPLLRHLAELLAAEPEWAAGRRVIVVPELNPDGLAAGRRQNARGVDLNRNFPAENFDARRRGGDEPLSEPESRVVHALLEEQRPARVLSFHQAADLLDYDGPGEELARMLEAAGPLTVRRMGARPGSLGSYAGVDLGIPIITVELPRRADAMSAEQLWEEYGGLLVTAVRGAPAPE